MNTVTLLEEVLSHDRKEWIRLITPYITNTISENNFIKVTVDTDTEYYPPLNYFEEYFQGKFNIGDYVSLKNYGGIYRITGLPFLDTRMNKYWYKAEDIDGQGMFYNAEAVIEHGASWRISGIDSDNNISGTEYEKYYYNDSIKYSEISLDDSIEANMKLITNLDQETKNKVNKAIYDFIDNPELLDILKKTE